MEKKEEDGIEMYEDYEIEKNEKEEDEKEEDEKEEKIQLNKELILITKKKDAEERKYDISDFSSKKEEVKTFKSCETIQPDPGEKFDLNSSQSPLLSVSINKSDDNDTGKFKFFIIYFL